MTKDEWFQDLFSRLDKSKFRSSFHLKRKDIDYIHKKGMDKIREITLQEMIQSLVAVA